MKVSFFIHRWKKESEVISLEAFVNDVRSLRWKVATEAYRNYRQRGMLKEAADVKDKMNGIVAAGTCRGGHAAARMESLSGWMMFDFDHSADYTRRLLELLRALPYVGVTFVSISGEGVKALVRIDVDTPEEYKTAYRVVGDELCRQVGFAHDPACSDLGRICSAVYDPEVYYRPDAQPFVWRDLAPQTVPVVSPVPVLPPAQAGGFIPTFLREFADRNPFVRGSRHDFMLKLGRVARYKGFSQEELEALTLLVTSRFTESDYIPEECRKDIAAGYQYVNANNVPETPAARGHKVHRPPLTPSRSIADEEDEEALSEKSNELRDSMPTFPESVFANLPDLLKRGLIIACGDRERDMLLMGMMANLSVCLPGVRFRYAGMEYSAHHYYAGVAPAGAGKGVVALAALLSQPTHDQYVRRAADERKAYDVKKLLWEEELKAAFRAKRPADRSLQPEEPHGVFLMLPANTSKSRTYAHLRDNGQLGAIINASEINTMVSALSQDYGKQDDVYCAATHHEDISSSFKVDGQPIVVHEPRLGMCLTGTPDQFVALVRSQENGLYSRFGILTAPARWTWHSAAPKEGQMESRAYFRGLGEEVLAMHNLLLETPTEVVFTAAQWEEHARRFESCLEDVVVEGSDSPGAIVVRHGLYAMRLAAVFTALRKAESRWYVKEYICTDEDFHAAMAMTDVLIEHSLLLSSSLPGLLLKARPLQQFHKVIAVLQRLKYHFSYTDFIASAMEDGVSESTAKRLLKRALKAHFIVNKEDGYFKNKKCYCTEGSKETPEP